MQLTARTENELITLFDSKNQIIGKLQIKNNTKECKIFINNKVYDVIREKWTARIVENNQTIYHLKTDKFWGTIKVTESNKEIRGVFGFTWATQLRDAYKQTLLKIRNENSFKNTGVYIIQLDKEDIDPLEILITLYGHIFGSIAKQNTVFLYS
ncbi:MAG TPA: hypothetical protein VLY87_07035 [Flavobacterium sp.]|nr:hypothetical protein [Flavobacterium sp.]